MGDTIVSLTALIAAALGTILTGIGGVPAAIAALLAGIAGYLGGGGIALWLKGIFYKKVEPAGYQKDMAARAKARAEELKPYEAFLTKEVRKERDDADARLVSLVVERESLLQKGREGSGYKPWDKAYDRRLEQLDTDIGLTEGSIEQIHKNALSLGKQRKGKRELDTMLAEVSADFTRFLGLELGSKFFGTESDLAELTKIKESNYANYYNRTEAGTLRERRDASRSFIANSNYANTRAEQMNAISVPADIKLKADSLGVDAAKLTEKLRFDPKLLEVLSAYQLALADVQRQLDNIDPSKAADGVVAGLYEAQRIIKELANNRVEIPVTAKLSSINEAISAVKGQEISLENLGLLPASAIAPVVAALQKAKSELSTFNSIVPDPNNLEPYLKSARELARVMAEARAKLADLKVTSLDAIDRTASTNAGKLAMGETSGLFSVPPVLWERSGSMAKFFSLQKSLAKASARVSEANAAGVDDPEAALAYAKGQRDVKKFTESLERLAEVIEVTISSAIGTLSNVISVDLFNALSPAKQRLFAGIGGTLQLVQDKLDKLKPKMAGTAVHLKLLGEQQRLELLAAKSAVGLMDVTKVSNAFGDKSLRLRNSEMREFIKLRDEELVIAIANKRLTGDAATDAVRAAAAKRIAREAREERAARTFTEKMGVTNEVFGLSLSDLDFSRFGGKLYELADGFKSKLDDAIANGTNPADILASIDLHKFKMKFVSALISARDEFRDALSAGVFTAFEKVKEGFANLDMRSYIKLSQQTREGMQRDDAELDMFKKILDISGMPQELANILNGPGSIQSKLEEVFANFGGLIPETPLNANTSALQALTAALLGETKLAKSAPALSRNPDVTKGVEQFLSKSNENALNRRLLVATRYSGAEMIRNMTPEATAWEAAWGAKNGYDKALQKNTFDSYEADLNAALFPEDSGLAQIAARFNAERVALQEAMKAGAGAMLESMKNFRNDITSGFKSALLGLFKGEAAEGQGVFETFANALLSTLSNAILTHFVNRISDALMDPLSGALGKLVEGMTKILSGDEGDGGIFKQLFGLFRGLFEGIIGMFSYAGTPAATGGMIVGPGTGTSDSIPALLSNGEYVINAAQTKRHLPLLHALNSGRISRFANGGLVSTDALQQPSSFDMGGTSVSNTQQININITGDISRQTKSEIYGMLPQIAAGVNAHNKEQNYRGY